MVTKRFYNFKPFYNSIEKGLRELNRKCQNLNVTKLAMPMIGCGLDQLDWNVVARIIDDVFSKSMTKITIYKYEKPANSEQNKRD